MTNESHKIIKMQIKVMLEDLDDQQDDDLSKILQKSTRNE